MSLHHLSTEIRYSLDMACYLLHQQQPRSIWVHSDEIEVVVAIGRRLAWLQGDLIVNSVILIEALSSLPYIHPVLASDKTHADAEMLLFPSIVNLNRLSAGYVVMVTFNPLSYKNVLYPGTVSINIFQLIRLFMRNYIVDQRIGMFTPSYLVPWLVSILAGNRFPELHFRAGQMAVDNLFVQNWMWRIGYIVIVAGKQRQLRTMK